MSPQPQAMISRAELDILKVLWEHGPGTVRQINEELRGRGIRWAYTTVQTLLSRLQQKGFVDSDTASFAHVFRAARERHELVDQGLRDLAELLCDGDTAPLVQTLVQGHRFSPDEIEEFRRLLDRLERDAGRKKTRASKERPT